MTKDRPEGVAMRGVKPKRGSLLCNGILRAAVASALAALSLQAMAAIEPAALFNDNMVLQRERKVPVWGRATAGNEIEVTFAGQSKTTTVAADGAWRVDLDPLAADAEAKKLVITESKPGWFGSTVDEKTFVNVLVGEVWLCGGQSNMTFAMWPSPEVAPHAGREMNGYYDLALTHEPLVRGVRMPICWSDREEGHAPLAWKAFVPESDLGGFSAAAWHYALRLRAALGIPVGVIESAWGGTCIETWIPGFAYAGSKSFKDLATAEIPTGVDANGKPLDSHQHPRACWNAMIFPLAPYAVRGVIWYQGCANRWKWNQYYEMLETLRAGWGKAFEHGSEMPFFICQITPFDYNWGRDPDLEAHDDGTCEIREEMERWGRDYAPFAGCVNLSDVGELDCIHPGDKRTVGTRLAAMALNRLYGFKDLKCDGPVFRKATLSGDGKKVTLTFDHVTGWCRKGTYAERFELAGEDGKYVPVACHYAADVPTVDLDVPAGFVPTKVAYLRRSCVHSFLKNEAGIPLGPFRGDVTKCSSSTPAEAPDVTSWHGANLLGMFNAAPKKVDPRVHGRFFEDHFRWLEGWGFNFARLPLDYRFLLQTNDWTQVREAGFAKVDEAVAWGRKHHVHVQICLHRAPGYTIASWVPETTNLQTDAAPQAAFIRIWSAFARRYRGIPNAELSFNLINEPTKFSERQFVDLFGRTIDAIRAEDPGRFVMLDGNNCASTPVPHFYKVPLTGQAFRGYTPHAISHYKAWYIKQQPEAEPTWPLSAEMAKRKEWIYEAPEVTLAKFADMRKSGYPVMIGEFGCYNQLSHATCLAWMEDCLMAWKREGLGWAVWNIDGAFGFLDSGRSDVAYEDFEGHKLDRKMLELLQKYARGNR